jgi:putative methyltransferase (TIGR04325 family)
VSLANLAESLLPLCVAKALRDTFVNTSFRGDYASFDAALQACGGNGLLKDEKYVELAFQARPPSGGVPFGDERFMQVLGAFALPLTRRAEAGRFRVLDFGGGPGAYYFFMRTQMPEGLTLEWDIFETALMAAQGRKVYASEPLYFFSEWQDILTKRYDVILASNTLHCFETPYDVVDRLASTNCKYFVVQDVPVIPGGRDRITIQMPPRLRVRKTYRKANFPLFPTWFFSEDALLKYLSKSYTVRMWWYSDNVAVLDGKPINRKGYLLEKLS